MENLFLTNGLAVGEGPLYLQLQSRIAKAMGDGRLLPGDCLPAERDLAVMTGLSRVTVRKGLAALVASGRLIRRRGAGTFVAAQGDGMARQVFVGAQVFDGAVLRDDQAVVVEGGLITDILPMAKAPMAGRVVLDGGILAPGFLDLQVNGGGGIMVDGQADLARLRQVCAAHWGLGSVGVLPTLITDSPQATRAVISAGITAAQAQVPGFLGLHLEGPHLDPRRKGAHDAVLIRPMAADDLAVICGAAANLPALMVTVAPEAVTPDQIAAMTRAGVVVSLGHTDCSHDVARVAMAAGARCVTHLFNAMSQLGNRAPGLVGAALDGPVMAGLIADGIHVHPVAMRLALAAKPGGIYLVSDCMAFAGSDLTEITLGGRQILRGQGRLVLADGTLAGADLTLPQAVGVMMDQVGVTMAEALAMVTSRPASVMGLADRYGHIAIGRRADLVHLQNRSGTYTARILDV